MPTHSIELGERIKKLRLAQNLTLKELEAKARVSATHLSEIERGLTSPTVGALVRIARALGEEPALLVDERARRQVAFVPRNGRRSWTVTGARVSPLGAPLDSAEMSMVEIELAPDGVDFAPPVADEEFVLVLAGAVEVRVGPSTHVLAEGDAMHYVVQEPRSLRARAAARVLWIASPPLTW